jgi:dephospho-CoA kinase
VGRWENKYVIGLTGNIATGKSLVRRMLEHLGAYTIDADGLAHQSMAPGAPAYQPVIKAFGDWILDAEGRIDRGKLGAVAFAHPDALNRLEALTHPVVGQAIDTLIQRSRHKVVVVEAIKLLEGHLAGQMDAIWVVDADEAHQLERLAKRGLSQAEAIKRIRAQNPQAEKLAQANVVIKNSGSPEDTWAQVRKALQGIQGTAEAEAEQATVHRVQMQVGSAGAGQHEIKALDIVRGLPRNADQIAGLLRQASGRVLTRENVLMLFGQKSYMMAIADNEPVGLVGFLVENLVTRVDEFFVSPQVPMAPITAALVDAIERASKELQSEVGYIFVPQGAAPALLDTLKKQGYERQELDDIRVPAWREAVRESRPDGTLIMAKKLRAERVLKPL